MFQALIRSIHSAADGSIKSEQCTLIDDGDQTEILGVDVDVVDRRDDETDLKFPWAYWCSGSCSRL
jgi:hypothetical protein